MSGGSYNYLCYKDSNEIHNSRSDIESMRDRLIQLGHLDAAKETESILLTLDAFYVKMQARIDRLNEVWHAVEWYDSGDYGATSVDEAIEKYRNNI